MAKTPEPLDWDAIEAEIAERNRQSWDAANTPEEVAKRKAKQEAEFERGVRNGWWDKDGNPIPQADEEAEDDEDE